MKFKDKIISIIGATCSIGGMIGILVSTTIANALVFVITALTGLFTISLISHNNKN